MEDAHGRNFRRAWHHIVCKRCGERLALFVIRNLFVQRGTDPLRDAPLHLAVYDHRIDHCAAIFRNHIVEYFAHPIVGIDRHDDRVGAVCKNPAGVSRLVRSGGLQQRIRQAQD